MTINLKGNLYQDDGDAVSGATVQALTAGTTSVIDTDTTDSDGAWDFDGIAEAKYDVKISAGTSVRYIKWNDMISLRELDVRNDDANTRPAATFTNLTNNASNQVAVFSGANTTRADDDEIYMSFKLANSAAELIEYARMTVVATDVTDGTEDGQIEFDVMKSGTFTKVWTITSSTAGAMSFDMNVDSLTIGSGADTDISLTFDANTADGVITWMEDEDYFQFSDEILMNSTEKILFGDTGTFIHQSSDGVLTITSDTTVDINGAVALDGAMTGVTSIYTTDLIIGEDSQTAIDFGTANEIDFKADNAARLTLTASALYPVTNNQIDLGTSSLEFKDAFFDGTVTADAFAGPLTGNVTGTADVATLATTVTITDNESTNEDNAVIFTAGGDVDGGSLGLESDGTFIYNPSTGTVTATIFKGNIDAVDGDFDGTLEADALTVGGTNVLTGSLITTLGTISAGVWNGTAIASAYLDSDTAHLSGTQTFTGAKTFTSTVTVGVDDTGQDVTFFGATSGSYMLWDESEDDLILGGVPKLFIGDTANANQTVGLTINMGAADDEIIALKSSDVTHGMTAKSEADTFLTIKKGNNTQGAPTFTGFSSGTRGLQLVGNHTTDNNTRSTGGNAAVVVRGNLRDGTGTTGIAADNNIFAIRSANVVFIVDSDGDVHYDGSTAAGAWDDYDDIALLDTVRAVTTKDYKGVFSNFTEEHTEVLDKTGVITMNDDGHHFISTKGLNGLMIDSIRQLSQRTQESLEELKEENNQLRQKLEALEV